MSTLCKDCLYYLPVDVFKGICKKSKDSILPDQADEKCFEKNRKCKYCNNFTSDPEDEQLGMCKGKASAYPDMRAQNCHDFCEIKG
ncbi:MAG: 4-hydroxyphenylacetate decarboxylase small subunit [Candidatus Xenobiia bacterium LiM19]